MRDVLKERLYPEGLTIPDEIINRIDATLENIPEHRKLHKLKFSMIAAVLALISSILVLSVFPSFADNIPVINSIFKLFNDNEGYVKYADRIDLTKNCNGTSITINEIVCDESTINISYTIKSEQLINSFIGININLDELKIDGRKIYSSSSSTGGLLDKHTCAGVFTLDVERLQLPENFKFSLRIDSISDVQNKLNIKGSWDFNLLISKSTIGKDTKTILVNKLCGKNFVEKIIFSPLNTAILCHNNFENAQNSDGDDIGGWLLFDDKNREIAEKGYSSSGDENGVRKTYKFDTLKEKPKFLTVIPYKIVKDSQLERVMKPLNLHYPLILNQGKIGSIVIKNIEFSQDKTVVHYSIKGFAPLQQADSIFFIDKDGNAIQKTSLASKINENDYTLNFKALNKEEMYNIATINFDTYMKIMDDEKFTIPLE